MWSEIVKHIQQLQQQAKMQGYPLWFRGQRDAKWTLMSSIHRNVHGSFEAVFGEASQTRPEAEKVQLLRSTYKTLYLKFKARAVQLLALHERSDWGIVFAMQHLGLPTRLLDWTESFPCAVYFAQLGRNRSDDAAVFILNPQRLNETVLGREGLAWLGGNASNSTVDTNSYHPAVVGSGNDLDTLAVAPELSNPRMVAQRAAFTLCGVSFQALEQKYPSCITKIVLPSNDFDEVDAFLNLTGRSHFDYFPDLEGLRDDLIEGMRQEDLVVKQVRNQISS